MATYTRTQLRNAVLQELGVVDAEAAPSEADAVIANDRCQQALEFLYDQGLIPFDLDGAIPARYFLPLVWVVAETLMLPYGVTSRGQILATNAAKGGIALAKLRAQRYMGETQQADYY